MQLMERSNAVKKPIKVVRLREVKEVLGAEVVCGDEYLDNEVNYAFPADFLSQVLSFARDGTLLITGITNPQVVRTAEMLDLMGIVFVRGKRPDEETIKLAQIKNVPLFISQHTMFETCGRLFENGLEVVGTTKYGRA